MLGIESDRISYGFLWPLEIKLQKGVEEGEAASWSPGRWYPFRPSPRFSVTWRFSEHIQAHPV